MRAPFPIHEQFERNPVVIPGPEEEANAESDAITGAEIDAETGVTLSETGGLEIVEGAVDIVLGVLGMIALNMDALNTKENKIE